MIKTFYITLLDTDVSTDCIENWLRLMSIYFIRNEDDASHNVPSVPSRNVTTYSLQVLFESGDYFGKCNYCALIGYSDINTFKSDEIWRMSIALLARTTLIITIQTSCSEDVAVCFKTLGSSTILDANIRNLRRFWKEIIYPRIAYLCVAFAPLPLPAYVLLEIVDFLPFMRLFSMKQRSNCVFNTIASIESVTAGGALFSRPY